MTDLRNRIPPSGPFVVDNNSRPIIASGGDQSQAQDVVAPATPTDLITLPVDTTGTKIAGVFALFTAQVELASTVALAKCTFELLINGASLSPPVGAIVQQDASGALPVVSVAFSGTAILAPASVSTLKIRCTPDANTTATVNPTATFCRTLELLFFSG